MNTKRAIIGGALSFAVIVGVSAIATSLIPDRSIRAVAMFCFGLLVGHIYFRWAAE